MRKRIIFAVALALVSMAGLAQNFRANMDPSVKPGDDFWQYAVGSWLKNNPLDKEHPKNGAFTDLDELNKKRINALIMKYANEKNLPQGSDGQKIGALYRLYMDSVSRNKMGYEPIVPYLKQVRDIKSREEALKLMRELDAKGFNGRPFVIAGHSQGSAILRLVLKKYFKEHPDYYKRMVAAYAIGYSITKDDLEANPHMKFATGESDTGVIISWHAEGPQNVKANVPIPSVIISKNGIAINPLNWKRDETYAPASENLGSIVGDEKTGKTEIRDIGGDAQVCLARGTVVTNAAAIPNEMTDLAGPQCYHQDDYSIFYNNIKDNVAKRIAAYQVNHGEPRECIK